MTDALDSVAEPCIAASPSPLQRFLRQRLFARLKHLRHGWLHIDDAVGTAEFGTSIPDRHEPRIHLRVRDMAFYGMLAGSGSVGAGGAYGDGLWQCDDLVGLVQLLMRNRDLLDGMEGGFARVGGAAMRLRHAARRNTRKGSRRNIAGHYDLGNEFFSLFLSPDLMYSSAMWTGADDTLEHASTRKLDSVCGKLDLRPGVRVVEIGTGWGGFALHAARHYGCHVTTTTISKQQHTLAARRIAQAGLQDRITLLLDDYRDLTGSYDRLVSIEMIEAIGAPFMRTYFATIQRLLKPDGMALLQAITIEDHRYKQAVKAVDFIKRYVFPGSFIPSIRAMLDAKTRATDMALVHLEDFGDSYARTLQVWRERFMSGLPAVRELGFDERFIKLWEFYLAYCEGGFRERSIGVSHLLLARPGARMHGRWHVPAQDGRPYP